MVKRSEGASLIAKTLHIFTTRVGFNTERKKKNVTTAQNMIRSYDATIYYAITSKTELAFESVVYALTKDGIT